MAAKVGQVIVDFLLNTAKFESDLKKATREFRNMGREMTAAGQTLTAGVTVPIVGMGAGILTVGKNFESAFQGVIKTVDATTKEIAGIRQGILDMSNQIPVAATELSKIAESAGQLGIKKSAILDFTRVVADLGVSTNLSSEQAATGLARLANITQMPQEQFSNLASTIVALGNAGASTESEIVEMGLRIAGAGNTVGMTMPQILGFANALSSVGIEADAGGSSISRVMVTMAESVEKGGRELASFGKVAGMSATQFSDLFKRDAASAIVAFVEGLGKMKESGQSVFGVLADLDLNEIRVRDSLLRAAGAGDLFRESLTLGNDAWSQNNALTKEATAFYSTIDNQFKVFVNNLKSVAVTFYDALRPVLVESIIPAFKEFAGWLKAAADWFVSLPQPVQNTVLVITALAAAIGPVLMVLGSIATGISTLLPLLGTFAAALSGPVGIVLAVTAVGAAIAVWAAKTESGRATIGAAWQWLKDAAASIFGSIKELVTAVTTAISDIWKQHGEQIKLILGGAWDLIKNIFSGAMTAIKGIIEGALKVLTGIIQVFHGVLTGDFKKMGEGIKNIVSGLWTAVKAIFTGAINAVVGTVKDMYDRVTGYFKGMYDKVVGHSWVPDMMEGIKSQFNRLPSIMTDPTKIQTGNVNAAFSGLNSSVGTIVPGMISDIGSQFGLLDGLMNGNVVTACQNVVGNFKSMISTVTGMIKDWKGTLTSVLGNIGSGILNAIAGGGSIWSGIKGGLSNFLGNSGLGSILGTGSGGGGLFSNLLGGGGASIVSSLFGGGVSSGVSAYAASLGLTGSQAAAATGTAGAAGGLGAMGNALAGFLTNPVTMLVGGGLAAGYGLYKLVKKIQGPSSWEALEKEVTRDYGGIQISAENIEKFSKSFGISENEAWDIRKNISTSPQFMAIMATAAEQQGKTAEFLKSLESVGTSWGTFNFRNPFEQGLQTGDWSALNNMWASISKLGDAGFGTRVTGGSETMLLTSQPVTAETSATAIDSAANLINTDSNLAELVTLLKENQNQVSTVQIETGATPISLTIEGAGEDLVMRIKKEVIPIIIQEMTGGNSGLREAIVRAYNLTAGAY